MNTLAATTEGNPDHHTTASLAYQLWQERGCPEGSCDQDWYEAELRLSERTSAAREAPPSMLPSHPAAPFPPGSSELSLRANSIGPRKRRVGKVAASPKSAGDQTASQA
mgnify:CR=1 FL=1